MGSFTKSLSPFRFLRTFLCHRSLINRSMWTKGAYIWNFVACDMPTLHDKNSSTVRIKVSHGMIWYDVVPVRPDSHCKQCRELSRSILRVTKLICGENRPSIAPRQFRIYFKARASVIAMLLCSRRKLVTVFSYRFGSFEVAQPDLSLTSVSILSQDPVDR